MEPIICIFLEHSIHFDHQLSEHLCFREYFPSSPLVLNSLVEQRQSISLTAFLSCIELTFPLVERI